jgi:hypothetical protein
MEQKDSKTIIYEVYFKVVLTFNTETWTLTKRNKEKIQAINMKFFRSIVRKVRMDRIRNQMFKEVEMQNLLIELEGTLYSRLTIK